jgi:hypothetical protein
MASSRVRRSRLVSPLVVAWAIGCAEDPVDRTTVQAAAGEQLAGHAGHAGHAGQLGRIHVVLQPRPDELEPEPQLQIHARFVEYRGVSEPQVRARVNMPVPAWEQLVMGQCIASEDLMPAAGTLSGDGQERELSMIDAGDLRVGLGNREFVAPVSLVPDILPWLSGVEYGHVDDRVPQLAVEPDGTSPLSITVDGAPDGEFEGFSVSAVVPAQLGLDAAKVTDDRLTIDWRPPGHPSDFIVMRLQGFTPGEDGVNDLAGEEVTCLVADSGRADLSLAPLANAGLAAEADLLRVSVSRFDITQVRAGSFGLVDVWVELRAQRLLHSGM